MKFFPIIIILPLLVSCFSNTNDEFQLEAEKMCYCVSNADSVAKIDTTKRIDLSELNFARCASLLNVSPITIEFRNAINSVCPDLKNRFDVYLKEMKRNFNQ